ncbi:hypothetical protein F4825DRAFT_237023 [Nemania diffusa]|nr:hypothetical protein F4825DRAFT_237023 [Nemania diffusa]
MANVPADVPLRRPLRALVHPKSKRRIRIRHPGYSQYRGSEDLLFQFAALDHVNEPSSRDEIWGAHYGTVITACGIITNNAFDQVYLSKDVYGKEDATTYRGILEHGDYWLQLRGRELPDPKDLTSTPQDDEFYQYPIVPSFWDWSFPHGKLPAEWLQQHNPPTQLQSTDNEEEQDEEEVDRCYLANLRIGVEKAHLVPTAHNIWMNQNEMDRYCDEPTSFPVDSKRNIISLMTNLHTVFDSGAFVIVPKPWVSSRNSGPPSASTTNSQSDTNGQSSVDSQPIINLTPKSNPILTANPASTAEPQLYAFAVHVLSFHPDAKDFAKLYHNLTIQPKYIGEIARECLFARFAWAIFPFLNNFLHLSTVPQQLLILDGKGTKNITAKPGQFKGIEKARKGSTSTSNSRKRGRGSSDENVELNDEDYAYEERWQCRSASRERWLSDYEYEDRDRGRSKYRDLSPESDNMPGLTDSFRTEAS